MIIDKELVVNNRKKADIVAELRKKGFRPFPKVAKAKVHGEVEDVVDEDDGSDFEGNVTDFDYLLGMAIWSLTKEKVRCCFVDMNITQLLTTMSHTDRQAAPASR